MVYQNKTPKHQNKLTTRVLLGSLISTLLGVLLFSQLRGGRLLMSTTLGFLLVFGWSIALIYFFRLWRRFTAREHLEMTLSGLLALVALRSVITNVVYLAGCAREAKIAGFHRISYLNTSVINTSPKLLSLAVLVMVLWAIRDGFFREMAILRRRERRMIRRNEHLSALHAVTQILGTPLRREEIIESALRKVVELMGMSTAQLYLFDEAEDSLQLVTRIAMEGDLESAPQILHPEGALLEAMSNQMPFIPELASADSMPESRAGDVLKIADRAYVPVTSRGSCLGMLEIRGTHLRPFSRLDIVFLSDVGQELGMAIEGANLLAGEQERRREVESLLAISRSFGATMDPDEMIHTVVNEARKLLNVDYASLRLFDENREALVCKAASGASPELERRIFEARIIPDSDPVIAEAVQQRTIVAISDMETDPRVKIRVIPLRSMLVAPLVFRDEVIGILYAATFETQHEFGPRDYEIANALAGHAAMTIESAQLYELIHLRAAELEEAKSFSDKLIEGMLDLVMAADSQGACTYINRYGAQLLGYEPEELIGQNLIPMVAVPESFDRAQQICQGTRFQDIEVPLRHRDGTRIAISWNGVLTRDADGRIMRAILVGRDIRERKQIDQMLRNRDRLLESAAAIANDLLITSDLDEAINHALKRLGITLETSRVAIFQNRIDPETGRENCYRRWAWIPEDQPIPVGTPDYTGIPTEAFGSEWYRDLSQGIPINGETEALKDPWPTILGARDLRSFLAVPIMAQNRFWGFIAFGNRPSGYNWQESEISIILTAAASIRAAIDRHHAEEELRRSEARYRGLVESQEELIVRVDPEGRFTFINDAYCRKFGKTRQELLGSSFTPLVHEEDLPRTLEAMKGLEEPPYRIQVEQRAMTAEGWRWIAWEDCTVKDATGKTTEIQAIGRDITDQKRLESEILRRNTELSVLNSIVETINQSMDLDEILGGTLDRLVEFVQADAACIALREESSGQMVLRASRGISGEGLSIANQMMTTPSDSAGASNGKPDRQEESPGPWLKALVEHEELRSFASVPLRTDREVLGALNIAFRSQQDFSAQDLALLTRAANSLATAVINSRLYLAEQRKAQSLAVLMREAHHRIRNNLQTVAGLLNMEMQKGSHKLDGSSLRKSLHRIKSVALVHELLLQENVEAVDMRTFAQKLAGSISHTGATREKQIQIEVTGDRIMLPSKRATSVALAINELVDNSIEHGFRDRDRGTVRIELESENGQGLIRISDDGAGLPPDFDLIRDSNVGLRVVRGIIVQDMEGSFSLVREGETVATIQFKRRDGAVRQRE